MVPPNLYFWSISRKESLESKQKHALRNRFLRTLFCPNDISNTGYNRKMLMSKKTSVPDRVRFNYEQLFHPVQCTAYRLCQCSSKDKLNLPEVAGILSISDHFQYFRGINCFGNGTRHYSLCLYQSGSSHIVFSYHYILYILSKITFLESDFSVSGSCCLSTTVSVSFSGESFGVVSTT